MTLPARDPHTLAALAEAAEVIEAARKVSGLLEPGAGTFELHVARLDLDCALARYDAAADKFYQDNPAV